MKPKRVLVKKHLTTLVIDDGTPAKCELCGNVEELRPYGPNKERVCFPCAMKDEAAASKAFHERIKGVDVLIIK